MDTAAVVPPWSVAERFALEGSLIEVRPYGSGLINDTYLVRTNRGRKGILQRINQDVFPHPEWVQANLRMLVSHWQQAPCGNGRPFRLPTIISARDGHDFLYDGVGFWRMSEYLEDSMSFDVLTDLAQAREMGFALGRFHALVRDLNPDCLHDTLPGFHVTPLYLEHFDRALSERATRLPQDPVLQASLDFVAGRRAGAGVLEEAKRRGAIHDRVIHGDPKLNNVLFDVANGRALSLIDLDTVKPGLIHYDLGDCLRSCCNRAGELGHPDQPVRFDVEIGRAVLEGYFDEAGEFLTGQDVELLFDAIWLMPFELGLRFLTDHLLGNVYFKVARPGQNLARARIQFELVRSIEQQEAVIRDWCRRSELAAEGKRQ